jgi:hypothetical protein
MEVFIRYGCALTKAFAVAIGATTPVQISGPISVNPPVYGNLYGLSAPPNDNRQAILVFNPSSTATLFVGLDNTVTGAGANAIESIGPLQSKPLPFNGTFILFLIGSASGATANIVELQ